MEGLWDMLSLRVSQVKLEHALFSDVCAEVGGFSVCVFIALGVCRRGSWMAMMV